MTALLLKDFYNLKKQIRILLLFSILYGVLGILLDNISFLTGILCILGFMLPITSFSFDDFSKWDHYALTLPLTRKQLVQSKYLLALIILGFATFISIASQFLYVQITGIDSFDGHFSYFLIGMISVSFLLNGISLPLVIKLGVEKSRIFLFSILMIPTIAIVFLEKIGIPLPDKSVIVTALLVLPLVSILFFVLSCMLSIKWYRQKEF